ncbi:MAG: hypothetical protein ACOX7P_08725 [Oscillospiraceae bacterium]|jgi:cell division septum initiation protein DivIVA
MELNKQGIFAVRFTCKRKKYYVAQEVDDCLDEIAAEADRLQSELRELRAEVEAVRAREKIISSAIVTSQAAAAEILEKAEAERERLLEEARREQLTIEEESRRMKEGLSLFSRELTNSVNKLFACFQETIGELQDSLRLEQLRQSAQVDAETCSKNADADNAQ